ncbi:uncharacterized mitochondrial protein-like protein, partial [Tanacetum coccineum]
SDQAEEGPTNYALMAYSSSSSDSKVSNDSTCSKSCLETIEVLKSHNEQLLKDLKKSQLIALAYKTDKLEFASESLDKLIKCQIVDSYKKGLGYNAVPPPYTGNFMPLTPDLSFTGLEEFTSEHVVIKHVVKNSEAKTSESKPKAIRKNNAHSTLKRPIHKNTTFKNININQRGKNLNTTRLKAVVNAIKGNTVNVVKASACWIWKPKTKVFDHGNPQIDLQDQGVIDSGCLRYITRNMSYLTEYEEIDGGYGAFGGNPKGRKITGIARTPQQNRVAERRNRTLIEAAKTMLADSKLPTTFWVEAVNTACYVQNRVFSESTPNVVGSGSDWLFHIDALTRIMNYEPIVADPKSSHDDESKPSSDDEKKVDEDIRKDSESIDPEKEDNANNTNSINNVSSTVNAASTNEVNDVDENINIKLLFDQKMSALEDYRTFEFSNDDGAEADMNNLDIIIQVSSILTTRIHNC